MPPGTVAGQVIRVAGRGAPSDDGAGDLLVHVVIRDIEVPRALVRSPKPRVLPFALTLAGVLAAAAAATLLL